METQEYLEHEDETSELDVVHFEKQLLEELE
jgi:hypothetical protein